MEISRQELLCAASRGGTSMDWRKLVTHGTSAHWKIRRWLSPGGALRAVCCISLWCYSAWCISIGILEPVTRMCRCARRPTVSDLRLSLVFCFIINAQICLRRSMWRFLPESSNVFMTANLHVPQVSQQHHHLQQQRQYLQMQRTPRQSMMPFGKSSQKR